MDAASATAALGYGSGHAVFSPPAAIAWEILAAPPPAPVSESEVIARGLGELRPFLDAAGLKRGRRVLLVLPDHTRRCRIELLLPALAAMLEGDFHVHCEALIAAGTHALQGDDGVARLVGNGFHSAHAVVQHDCRDDGELEPYGLTARGTPVVLSRRLRRADLVITVGGVLFHYFAGFGGGPKMVFPGLAGYESIKANHALSLDLENGKLHPGCREGELDGNPVYQDLAEAAAMVPGVVSWQVLAGPAGSLCRSEAGPPLPTHRRMACHARELYSIPVAAPADVVVASAGGHPADIDLIQAHKAIHHAFAAVKRGGWLVMLAACTQGAGSPTLMAHFEAGSAAAIVRKLGEDYQLNGQTALALRQKAEATRIVLVSGLDPALVEKTGMIPAAGIEEAWDIVRRSGDRIESGYIFPQASLFVPILAE